MKNARHNEIEQRAYFLWEQEGRPHGRHFEHWLRAEAELGKPPAGKAKTPRARKPSAKKGSPRR